MKPMRQRGLLAWQHLLHIWPTQHEVLGPHSPGDLHEPVQSTPSPEIRLAALKKSEGLGEALEHPKLVDQKFWRLPGS